jgi:trk system potassium uptake protein TrkA
MGCDALAASVAITLSDQGHAVYVLDPDVESFDRLPPGKIEAGEMVPIAGDGTVQQDLLKAGVQDADVFMALSDSDTRNALAGQIAKSIFQVPTVISRIDDPVLQEMYKGLGIQAIGARVIVTGMAVKAASESQ